MRVKSPAVSRVLTAFSIVLILALPFLYVQPVSAATIFEDGFETGDFSKWTVTGGSPSVTSGDAHHGTYKAVLDAVNEYAQARFFLAPVDHCFMRAYVMFKTFPAAGQETAILGVMEYTTLRHMAEARVVNDGGTMKWRLHTYNNGELTVTSTQHNPVLNTWYCVEVEGKSNTTTGAEARIYIDGNELTDISQTGKNNNLPINCGYIYASTAITRWYDCVVIDTTYIGPECNLTVNVAGSGSVAKLPDQAVYDWATNVTLTANPTVGWSFDHWSGDASGTDNPVTINMTSDKTITATFTQNTYTLTITPMGGGVVNSNNSGPYYYGDVVELTGVPSIGWSFDHWGNDLTGSVNPETILIDGDKSVTATFTQNTYTLTVTTVGSGSVNLNNSGPYYYNDVVELTANPATGWSFDNWSEDLSGLTNPETLIVNGNKAVTATFSQNEYTLTVNVVGNGVVNLNNTGPYHYGDIVELTAAPVVGWSFSSWSGDLGGSSNPTAIIIDGNKAATATFTQNTYALTVTTVGTGSVSLNNSGPYHYGDVVELTAVPTVGWSFQGWSGDLLGSANPATIVIDGNKAVTATFTRISVPISVSISPMDSTISLGSSVPFTSTVTGGTSPYTYQWYVGGYPILDATSDTWTFTPTAPSIYYIHLQVTDSSNTTASSETARVTVYTTPVVVGGYSVHISTPSMVQPATAYTVLMCLSSAMLAILKRKRK